MKVNKNKNRTLSQDREVKQKFRQPTLLQIQKAILQLGMGNIYIH